MLLILLLGLSACSTYPGTATVGIGNPSPRGEETVVRGVVNGLYAHDPQKMTELMVRWDEHLPPEEVAAMSDRYGFAGPLYILRLF